MTRSAFSRVYYVRSVFVKRSNYTLIVKLGLFMLDDKDLPRLMTFSTGEESFYEMASVSLSSIIVSDD